MHLLIILLVTSGIAWVLKETDYIVPVTAGLVILLIVTAINPGIALFMLMAMGAIILLSLLVAFLPQVLGFILGALLLVVCIILAGGAARAEDQRMDRETCGEIVSDLAEYGYYAKGWKDVVPSTWDKDVRILLYKKDREVEFTCSGGWMRIEERPHKIQLQMDIKPLR